MEKSITHMTHYRKRKYFYKKKNEKNLYGISMIEYLCKGLFIHIKFETAFLSIELIAIVLDPIFTGFNLVQNS